MRALFPILLGLAACGPDNNVIIDARPPIDAPRDAAAIDAPAVDAAIDAAAIDAAIDARAVDAAIDAPAVDAPIDAPGIDAIDAPPPCQTAIQTFTLDGALDGSATVIAGGVTSIRVAVAFSADGTLYVATDDAGEGSDHFVLVAASAPGVANFGAPFAKAGQVAVGTNRRLFLADENDNDFEGWFQLEAAGGDTALTGVGYAAATAANGGVLEGTVDLVAAFGAVPDTVYLAAVPYATGDGGALVSGAQTPAGNGDGNVDAAEFVAFPVPCNVTTTKR